jgi:hypothetical protein
MTAAMRFTDDPPPPERRAPLKPQGAPEPSTAVTSTFPRSANGVAQGCAERTSAEKAGVVTAAPVESTASM